MSIRTRIFEAFNEFTGKYKRFEIFGNEAKPDSQINIRSVDIAKIRQRKWDDLNAEIITISKATNERKEDILKMTVNEFMSLWTAHNRIATDQEEQRKQQEQKNKWRRQ